MLRKADKVPCSPFYRGFIVEVPKVTELFLAAEWRLGPSKQAIRSVFQVDEGWRGIDQDRAWEEAMGRGEGRAQEPWRGQGGRAGV